MTREEAAKYIKSRCIGSASERDGTKWSDAMWTAIEALSADRPQGEWIMSDYQRVEDTDNDNYLYNCSVCWHGDVHARKQKVPYCWWCGARMKRADDENVDVL